MSAFLSHRFLYVASGFASVMFGVTVAAGVLPKEYGKSPSVIAAILLLTVFVFREWLFVVRFHRASELNTSVSGDVANESSHCRNQSLRIPDGRRLAEACFMGILFAWLSVLASNSPFRFETGPLWPWLLVWWLSHVMSVVSKVERANDFMIFHTAIGTHSIPLCLLKSVTATVGSGYFLHFKFRCGTVNVMNPKYPFVDLQSIKASLGIDGLGSVP